MKVRKTMKTTTARQAARARLWPAAVFALAAVLGLPGAANAQLSLRLGNQAVYDDDLNITWLANANAAAGSPFDDGFSSADGRMTWHSANAWAASLTVGGFTDWRLPTTTQPDSTCSGQLGLPPQGSGFACTGSELGHLFYDELGGAADSNIQTTNNGQFGLFKNVQSSLFYWSGTEFASQDGVAWVFGFGNGLQSSASTSHNANHLFAWAVRTGDVAAVPEPPMVMLFALGLFALLGCRRVAASARR